MTKEKEVFADGVLGVGYEFGVIRIDLFSNSVTEKDEDGRPQPEFKQRIVMTTEGFANSFMAMQNLMDQLVKAGVIDKEEKNPTEVEDTQKESEASNGKSIFN